MPRISQMFTDEYGNPTSIPMKIAQCWEVEDQEVPGGRRSIPSQGSPGIVFTFRRIPTGQTRFRRTKFNKSDDLGFKKNVC